MAEQDNQDQLPLQGQTDGSPQGSEDEEEKQYPESYVKGLRTENAARRKKAEEAESLALKSSTLLSDLAIKTYSADILADPADLLLNDPKADIYDEEGFPDAEKIRATAEALRLRKPHLAARRFGQDVGAGPRGKEPEARRSFADMLKTAAG